MVDVALQPATVNNLPNNQSLRYSSFKNTPTYLYFHSELSTRLRHSLPPYDWSFLQTEEHSEDGVEVVG